MDRSKVITALRPKLELEHTQGQSELERFQNDVIRPIIKFQHEIIIRMVSSHRFYANTAKRAQTAEQYRALMTDFIAKQKNLRQQLIGSVTGLFTIEEHHYFGQNASELERRIVQIIGQRVIGTLGPTGQESVHI